MRAAWLLRPFRQRWGGDSCARKWASTTVSARKPRTGDPRTGVSERIPNVLGQILLSLSGPSRCRRYPLVLAIRGSAWRSAR